jgi:hypothetical protein
MNKTLCAATSVIVLVLMAGITGCSKDSPSTTGTTTTTAASETPTATTSVTTTTAPAANSPYVGEWTGHTRHMTIRPNGTASIQINDGAADGEHWNTDWTTVPTGIAFTLKTQTSKVGNGLGDGLGAPLVPGMIWNAALEQHDDGTIMHFVRQDQKLSDPDAGLFWCREGGGPGFSHDCGA